MTQEEAMNMSNEQAVQILIPMRNMMCDQNGCPISDAVFALDKAIEALSADRPQEWIPCSERLPEKDGRYLVTYPLLWYNLWVSTAWYGTPPMPSRPVKGKCFFVSDDEYGDVPYYDVLAWMPLPEPWKGGEE